MKNHYVRLLACLIDNVVSGTTHFTRLLVVSCVMMISVTATSQVNIIDPNASMSPDVSTCSGTAVLETILQFTANGSNPATATVNLPTGMSYVPGSVMVVSQVGGLSVISGGGTPSTPVFTITASDGAINSGNEIRISWRIKADCSTPAGTQDIPISVNFLGASTGEISLDVISADLNITTHTIQTASIGTPVTVPIQIQNGGLGAVDSLDFFITETGMTTQMVMVGAINATLISTIGNTKRYRIYSNALPGGTLNNPEFITVMRKVVLTSCTYSSSYEVNWGCNGMFCQMPQPTALGEFVLQDGTPNLTISSSILPPGANTCGNVSVDITFTNNGTGPASAAAAFNNKFTFGMNSASGWSSANWMATAVTLAGNNVTFSGGMNGVPIVVAGSQFVAMAPGGMNDLDLDGQFDDIPQGGSVTFRVTLKYTCPSACPAPSDEAALNASAMSTNQCGMMLNFSSATAFNFINNGGGSEIFYPSTVSNGQKFNVTVCVQRSFSGANCSANSLMLNLNLPPNIMATGTGNVNGTPVSVTTSGSVASLSGDYNTTTTCFTLELMYTCGGGLQNFNYEVLYTCDAACSCVQKWGCGNFTILGKSCAPCPNGGLTATTSIVSRTTLGYTNHTGVTVVNPNTLPAASLRKGMPCDEFKFTVNGTMNGGTGNNAAFNNGFLEISYDQLAGANLLQYIATGSTFDYFDQSTGITTTGIAMPLPVETVIGGRHVFIFNFNTFIQSLPGGQIRFDDRVVACPLFRILNNSGLTATPVQTSNLRTEFFNLSSAAGNPLPGGDARFTCDYNIPELYLHNPAVIPNSIGGARMGCGNYLVQGSINHQLTVQNDEYPNEIRPLFRLNSIKVTILNGDSYDPSFTPQLMVSGSSDDPWYMGTFNLPAPTISGNMLTWTNPGNWPIHDLAGNTQTATGYNIKFRLTNSGCANATDGNLQTVWNYNRYGYAPTACQVMAASPTQTGVVTGGAPVFKLTNISGSINASKEVECFDVKIENTTANPAGYVWLALEDNLSDMDVVSVTNLSTNTTLPLLTYSNGKWVKVNASWPGSYSQTLRICVKYNNCANNTLAIRQGWNCSAYPANPTTYSCPTQLLSTNLIVAPKEGAIQGDFIATSSLPASMCQNFTFDIKINSSQQGDILNPRVKVKLPIGMNLLPPVQVEYALNAGNWQNATPVINGQMIEVLLGDHTLIQDSLPGTTNANMMTYPAGEDRQARIRFTVRTTCDYFSGDRIVFQPFAERTCGGAAAGSGTEFKSPRIRIQGAEPTYEGTFSLNFGSNNEITGCAAQTINITTQLADLNASDGLPAMTGSADTIYITMPAVLDYVPGTFMCTTIPVSNCPVFIGTSVVGGRNLLKFALPPNIMIPNGGVVPINFKFEAQPEQEISCTIQDEITGRIIAVYENIACSTPAPGTVCPKVTALSGEGEFPLVLRKRSFTFETPAIACNSSGTFNYTLPIRLQNGSLAAGETVTAEIYCLDAAGNISGNPIRLLDIVGPKASGSLTTFTGTFGGCDAVNGVKVVIPMTTFAGNFQCHCGMQMYTYRNISKCPTVTVSANDIDICANETVTVTATLTNAANGGTWSTSGTGTFANPTALSTIYTPSTADRTAGMVTLKFTTNDLTGTCPMAMATVAIVIRPLPTVVNATLTVCANSGSANGTFNLNTANALVDPVGGNVITYHTTLANARTGTSPLSSPYTAANNTIIYARVRNPITGCYNTATVTLRVNSLPTAANATLAVCENDPTGSGLGTFSLISANATINNTSGNTITFHNTLTDAQAGVNALPDIIISASRIIYARVVNTTTGCSNTAQVTLTVRARPRAYAGVLEECPIAFDGLTAIFTLSEANVQTTGGVSGLTVSYHANLADAEQDINPLPNTYISVTNNIWVRVEDSNGCYAIDILQLVVLENPVLEATSTSLTCAGINNASAIVQVTSGPVPITYDWSNDGAENPDNDAATITNLSAGIYTVTVTDGNGCTATDFVVVNPAPAAVSISVNSVRHVACSNGSDGAVFITVTGGTPNYSYNWSVPAPDVEDPQGLSAGVYTVTVTDANGCTATSSTTINQPASALSAVTTVTTTPTACNATNGAASVTPAGGVPGYTYLWSNGQTTSNASGMGPGAYVVTVTDANGCTVVATVVIPFATAPVVVIGTSTNVLCYSGNTGSATAAVQTGTGTAPYSFAWSNGQTGPTATNLTAGTYGVTATDANGCKGQTSVTIFEPTPLNPVIISTKMISCFGYNNGSATVYATGGTSGGGYTYLWSNGQTGPTAVNLSPGVHTVSVTDANGCIKSVSTTITQPTPVMASIAAPVSNVGCFGENTGAINLSVSGGTPNYNYNWSGNAPDIEDPSGLVAGTYTVTVTDINGCTTTLSQTISQPSAPLNAAISSFTNASCNGAATGTATVAVSGGTPAYTYLWSNGQTTQTATGLQPGSYIVSATDLNGCTAIATVNIANPALLDLNISFIANASCNGASDGEVVASTNGGTPPYEYTFFNASNVIIQGPGALNSMNNLVQGNYTVKVTDHNGCTDLSSFIIGQPTMLSVTVTATTPVSCFGGSNGTATALASGGAPGYTYQWPGGFTGVVRTNLAAGTYIVTVTDSHNCTATANAIIIQPAASLLVKTDLITHVLCKGSNSGAIFMSVSGGTPNYGYNWSDPAQDVEDPVNLVSGTYNLTVTDDNGCTATSVVVVNEPATTLSATISNIVNAQCTGTGTGSARVNPVGGTPGYTYLWSNGQTTQTATNLLAGSYVVTVTDLNGCTALATVVINNPANLNIAVVSVQHVQCSGASNGGAEVQATGGSPMYLFEWSNMTSGSVLSGVGAGMYGVTVTDNNGCEAVTSVTITEPTPVIASIIHTKGVSCLNAQDGTATALASGGIGPYTYEWPGSVFMQTASGLAPGIYTVTVYDDHNCTSTATAVIPNEPSGITIGLSSQHNVSCFGGNDGHVNITVSGGTPNYQYNWSGSVPDVEDPSGLTAGTYTVTVTDHNGCTATTSVTITAPPIPLTATASGTNPLCHSASNGTATVVTAGGTAPYSYLWSNGQTTTTATGMSAGAYVVTVTDDNGCQTVATVVISNPALLSAVAIVSAPVSCYNSATGAATVIPSGGTPGYSYVWRNAANAIVSTSATASGLPAGLYSVTVTDINGCSTGAYVQLSQPTQVVANILSTQPVSCTGGIDGTATAIASGGTAPYMFSWSDNGSGRQRMGLAAGTYTVTVSDINGCTGTTSVVVTQPASSIGLGSTNITNVMCHGANTGAINITPTGGTPPYSFDWSSPAPDVEDPANLSAGTYTVVVTDAEGCTIQQTFTITQPAVSVSAAAQQLTNAPCGSTAGSAMVTALGGTSPYSYLWSNGQNLQTATGMIGGSYVVSVTDAKGCTAVATVNIDAPGAPAALISSQTPVTCFGGNDGTATVSVTGGTPPYTYVWSGSGSGTNVRSGLSAGQYLVTVSDASLPACTVVTTVVISQPTDLFANVLLTAPTSCDGAINGQATVSAAGGVTPYTFTWPGNLTGATQTGLAAGAYLVTATDDNGCTETVNVSIGSNGQLNLNTLPDIGPLCPGQSFPLTVLGSQPVDASTIYSWSGGVGAGLSNGASTGLTPNIPSFTASNTEGTYAVTVTANLQGCTTARVFDVMIEDSTPPTFNCPNQMLMVGNDPDLCAAKVNWTTPVAQDDCGSVSVMQKSGPASGSVFPVGLHDISYVANDGHGNTTECAFQVLVLDTEFPDIMCPSPPLGMLPLLAGDDCTYAQTTNAWNAVATDNCGVVSLVHDYAAPSPVSLNGAVFPIGTTVVLWTASDLAGHNVTCSTTIVVSDKTSPTVVSGTCPGDINVNNDDAMCGAVVDYSTPLFNDNCDGNNIAGIQTSGLPSGALFPLGTTLVQFEYVDAAGNVPAICAFVVTVNDAQTPQISCPSNITVTVDGVIMGANTNPFTLVGTGPCGVTLSYTPPVGTDNCPGSETDLISGFGSGANYYEYNGLYTHIWRVTDASGNSSTCSFVVEVEDPIVPVITCPSNITIATDNNQCTAGVTYSLPLVGDNCPGFTINQLAGPASGEAFALGATTVSFEVVDDMGNATSCSFEVTVKDMQIPSINVCPPAMSILTSTSTDDCIVEIPDLTDALTASDNCTPGLSLVVQQSPIGGSTFGGTHGATQVVSFSVTDLGGNTSTCTTLITLVDDEAPTITCLPALRTVSANANCQYMTSGVEFDAIAMDNCVTVGTIHNYASAPQTTTLSGAVFPIGNTVVNFTATDANGNTTMCSITVQVVDNQMPVFVNCPSNITVNNDVDQCGRTVLFPTPVVQDNCGATVMLVAPSLASGSVFPSGPTAAGFTSTVTFRATDAAGNSTDCVFTVTVLDKQMPKAICRDFSVNLDATGNASITPMNINGGSSDNCTTNANLLLAANRVSFNCSDEGLNYVVLTVTDQAGNVNNCVATVTVNDVTPPVITCPANITLSNCNSPVPNVAALTSAMDACGVLNIIQNPLPGLSFGQAPGSSLTIQLTATDVNGNTSTCTVNVSINDNVNPTIVCPANITVGNDVAKCGANVIFPVPTFTDNCGATMSQTSGLPTGALFPVGVSTVIFTATDATANQATCSFTVTVMDMQPPAAVCQNVVLNLNSAGVGTITTAQVNGGSSDNCSASLTYALSGTNFSCVNVGQNNVTLSVTDGAGNTSTCVSTITVRDIAPPTFTCPAPITVDGCNVLVPDVISGITDETDNCGVISTVQNPVAGLSFGQMSGNTVPITVTVTDVNGNTTACVVMVTIEDDDEPDFLNCPTTMIMIGNDPDQCSGKVNWQPPVAVDDCIPLPISAPGAPLPGTVVQTGGPLPGSSVAITCPPTPTTITYVATDGSGNQSTCSFNIMVTDTQAPRFDADIVMPGNTTVACDAIPDPCIARTDGSCSPLTNADVNDNCTAPSNITVTYQQISTQGSDPAQCGFYQYVLTRTWTVTDCAGNILRHTQVIQVEDKTAPAASCRDYTAVLDKTGKVAIIPDNINNGTIDPCAAPQNLTYSINGQTVFTCANLGANVVTLTVSDPCGNSSACMATVTVQEGIAPCTPEYTVETICLDNATDENNGQFQEMITIKSLAMQNWLVTANDGGFFSDNSPNPPATPVVTGVGTPFLSGTADGIDNDNDGTTDETDEMVFYTLKGRFTECIGYNIAISNAGAGNFGMAPAPTTTTFANKACYPNPYFLNLYDPFCLNTPPFQIQVGEYNNASGAVMDIMVNGVSTSLFDAAALGLGFHTVMATFDAGLATNTLTINGVLQPGSGTMSEAQANPGCRQKITKIVQILNTPTSVTCNDLVHVSLDSTCMYMMMPDDVLEGTYYCYDDYMVEIDRVAPTGNGPWTPAKLTAADIGKTWQYRLIHPDSGNSCWGYVKIEDKLAPKLTCPPNLTLHCNQCSTPSCIGTPGIFDCDATITQFTEVVNDPGTCTGVQLVYHRTWVVTDASGNQSSCQQTINIIPFDFADVQFPPDITINCNSIALGEAATTPGFAGAPSISGFPIGNNGLCAASVGYDDVVLNVCPGDYEIIRKWLVRNACLPLGPNNPIERYQLIKVIDTGGPIFACPSNLTVSTDATQCCATVDLPDVILTEHCSNIISLNASVIGRDSLNNAIQIGNSNGTLSDFPGNNYWIRDTLGVFGTLNTCLNIGNYQVTYTAQDQCNNVTNCSFNLAVRDLTPPDVVCTEVTQISLGSNGMALVDAKHFDQGSTDNCATQLFYKVRRMEANPCQASDKFFDSVKFCCEDAGDSIQVILRVYQVDPGTGEVPIEDYLEGQYNDCMIWVLVEDKIKPTCTPPALVNTTCELFDESLWAYGQATATDNCCLDTIITTVNRNNFDTVCNKGTITRTFRAEDCHGNTSTCTQRIIVTYEQDYFVKFPNDRIITVCDGTGNYGAPEFFGEDCELLGVSFEDVVFTVVPDACFKIERTWQVINWCTYNPNLPCIYVPNPNPSNTTNAPANLTGPIVSACGTPQPWNSTVIKINPTDATATDYCSFYNANANCYQYKQIIKVIDTQDPSGTWTLPTCETQNWYTANDAQFWNDTPWWDATHASHDLCEEPTDLSIVVTDACSAENVNVEYTLFLDLDGDGVMETIINSTTLPGFNRVYFGNNDGDADLVDGDPRAFDFRPVLPNQKWGFALRETVDTAANNKTFAVRWWNQQQASVAGAKPAEIPQLPHGTHKIKWFIQDGCGNDKVEEYTFTVKDCKAPTVVCLNGLSVNIMPTGMITMWASDFLQYTEDNCTPNPLKLGIRKSGTGTGFPVDANGNPITQVTFTCDDLGTNFVELWAIDAAGNADYCETYVIVQDNDGNCVNIAGAAKVAGTISTEVNDGLEEAGVEISGSSQAVPTFNFLDATNVQGIYNFNAIPLTANAIITPVEDDNPLNGVSTYDLVLISKHILGIETLNSPYKMIAADANKSGSITTFDIVELRKLLLGIYQVLPNNTSWRFVDKSFTFPNTQNPFQTQFAETRSVSDIQSNQLAEDFVSVKVGDVNNSAQANSLMQADDRTAGTLLFDVADQQLKAGEETVVTFKASDVVAGYQFTMVLNGLKAKSIQPISGDMSADNFAIFDDAVTTSFNGKGAGEFAVTFRAEKAGKLSEMLQVSSRITKAEAYNEAGRLNVAFRYDGKVIAGQGFELYQNAPNPFVAKTQIGFYLPEAANATLRVFDASGRVIWEQSGAYAKGQNSIWVDRAAVGNSGILYYTLETETDSATKKMIVVR